MDPCGSCPYSYFNEPERLIKTVASASTFAGVRPSASSFLFSHSIVRTIFTCVVGSWSAVVTGTEEDDDAGPGY